jgi:hypothetical protein
LVPFNGDKYFHFSEPSHASEKMVVHAEPPEGVVTRGGSYAWAYDEKT